MLSPGMNRERGRAQHGPAACPRALHTVTGSVGVSEGSTQNLGHIVLPSSPKTSRCAPLALLPGSKLCHKDSALSP